MEKEQNLSWQILNQNIKGRKYRSGCVVKESNSVIHDYEPNALTTELCAFHSVGNKDEFM